MARDDACVGGAWRVEQLVEQLKSPKMLFATCGGRGSGLSMPFGWRPHLPGAAGLAGLAADCRLLVALPYIARRPPGGALPHVPGIHTQHTNMQNTHTPPRPHFNATRLG